MFRRSYDGAGRRRSAGDAGCAGCCDRDEDDDETDDDCVQVAFRPLMLGMSVAITIVLFLQDAPSTRPLAWWFLVHSVMACGALMCYSCVWRSSSWINPQTAFWSYFWIGLMLFVDFSWQVCGVVVLQSCFVATLELSMAALVFGIEAVWSVVCCVGGCWAFWKDL